MCYIAALLNPAGAHGPPLQLQMSLQVSFHGVGSTRTARGANGLLLRIRIWLGQRLSLVRVRS